MYALCCRYKYVLHFRATSRCIALLMLFHLCDGNKCAVLSGFSCCIISTRRCPSSLLSLPILLTLLLPPATSAVSYTLSQAYFTGINYDVGVVMLWGRHDAMTGGYSNVVMTARSGAIWRMSKNSRPARVTDRRTD